MKKNTVILLATFLAFSVSYAQVPFPHIPPTIFNAERVASFGVMDVSNDFLEITNSTVYDNSFIPSIWAHQQSDSRFVLRHFATTNSSRDNGNIPMMIFRTEIRNNLNHQAPAGGSFPWGENGSDVAVRPLFGWENGNTQLVRILANGNVGINTITPTAKFQVNGSLRFPDLANATNPQMILGTDDQGNVFEYNAASFMGGDGAVSDSDWLKPDNDLPNSINDDIYTNGNIGVNIQNPTSSIHVDGTLRFENLSDALTPTKVLGTDNLGNVFEYDPQSLISNGVSDADWLKFDDAVTNSINDNIYTNGKVAININNFPNQVGNVDVSTYSLVVQGGILTEEVRVALNSEWADFVFEEDYNLETLEVVEEYIEQNNHLKGVPSAAEVELNGIELGEMNKILLLKIEELYLYMIKLNKKVEEQEKKIAELKAK